MELKRLDIIDGLKKWDNLKLGQPFPNALLGDGKWSAKIALDILDAIAEIERLRALNAD